MTTRNTGGWKRIAGVPGTLLVLLLVVGLLGLSRSPVTPQVAVGPEETPLLFVNETGSPVAGIQIVFDVDSLLAGDGFTASSEQGHGQVFACGNCLWVNAFVPNGEALRLELSGGSATGTLVKAYWYSDSRAFLNALWQSFKCSVL